MARYIDADKLCDSLRESYNRLFELYKKAKDSDAATICEAELNTFMECIIRAKTQSTADVEKVKHGEWVKCQKLYGIGYEYVCSACKKGIKQYEGQPICCECGAKMDGGNAE